MELVVLSCSSAGSLARDRGLENPGFSYDGKVLVVLVVNIQSCERISLLDQSLCISCKAVNNNNRKRNNTRCSLHAGQQKPVTQSRDVMTET